MAEVFPDARSLPPGELDPGVAEPPFDGQTPTAPLTHEAARPSTALDTEFEELFRAYYPRLEGKMAASFGTVYDRPADHAQEAMIRLWKSLVAGKAPTGSTRSWLTATARHCAVDAHRRRQVRPREVSEPDAEYGIADTADGFEAAENRIIVDGLLAAVSSEHRQILELTYLENLTVAEVAKLLGVPAGTVKSRLHYARKAVRASEAGAAVRRDELFN